MEEGGVVTISRSSLGQHGSMKAKDEKVDCKRKENQASSSSNEVLEEIHVALRNVTKPSPEVKSSEGTDIKDNEEPDKLDRYGAGKANTKSHQPPGN